MDDNISYELERLRDKINDLEKKLDKVKNHEHCPNCGEVMDVGDDYCSEECAVSHYYYG
ncbi:DUF2116 family Zn-ribbon domain-containing protein [Candidatus Woesearchaeota archaeon]|nr:DUF2116 family Zn-ribbon domain-containing protein [Candidatus Woesearchaeota archaeon]HLD78937.1 DUF2116 family Zn-ribbon domain-containing protein [Candidatus Nanoarchaeia archaeon]